MDEMNVIQPGGTIDLGTTIASVVMEIWAAVARMRVIDPNDWYQGFAGQLEVIQHNADLLAAVHTTNELLIDGFEVVAPEGFFFREATEDEVEELKKVIGIEPDHPF